MVRLLAFVGLLGLGLLALLAIPLTPSQRDGLRPAPVQEAPPAAPAPLPEAQRRLTESPADVVRRSLRPVVYGTAQPVPPPPPVTAAAPAPPPPEAAEAPQDDTAPPAGWHDPNAGQWSDTLSAGWTERGVGDGSGADWFTNDDTTGQGTGDWSASVSTPRGARRQGGWIDASPVVVTLSAASSGRPSGASASASSANVVAREAARSRQLRVQARRANLRDGPATTGGVIEQLSGGEAVLLLEDPGTGWLLVRREADGVEGWIAASLLGR